MEEAVTPPSRWTTRYTVEVSDDAYQLLAAGAERVGRSRRLRPGALRARAELVINRALDAVSP
jgi:hypothetical protein